MDLSLDPGVRLAESMRQVEQLKKRNAELEEIVGDLATLTKHQGNYIRTWQNGTEEHGPSFYDVNEVGELVAKAFNLTYPEGE